MLLIAEKLHQLHFGRLMEVYAEGNRENGACFYPNLPPQQGILEAEQDFYRYLKDVFFSTEGAFYAVWEENGRYYSALRLEPYRDGLLMEAVETAPERRRQGHARRLMEAVFARMGKGAVYVHIDKDNAPSIALHKKMGFERIQNYAVYIDGSVNQSSGTYRLELGGETWRSN